MTVRIPTVSQLSKKTFFWLRFSAMETVSLYWPEESAISGQSTDTIHCSPAGSFVISLLPSMMFSDGRQGELFILSAVQQTADSVKMTGSYRAAKPVFFMVIINLEQFLSAALTADKTRQYPRRRSICSKTDSVLSVFCSFHFWSTVPSYWLFR